VLILAQLRKQTFLIVLLAVATPAMAQRVEVSPFVGYRGGGGIATINGSNVVGTPNGPSAGAVADVVVGPLQDGTKVEVLFSREQVEAQVNHSFAAPTHERIAVDQLLVGGLYDLSPGRIRPFLAGGVGFTRFGSSDGSSWNFAVGGSAGAKFYANRHLGARIDGRLYVTIVDATATGACGGGCVIGIRVSPATQFEFTAGLVVGF